MLISRRGCWAMFGQFRLGFGRTSVTPTMPIGEGQQHPGSSKIPRQEHDAQVYPSAAESRHASAEIGPNSPDIARNWGIAEDASWNRPTAGQRWSNPVQHRHLDSATRHPMRRSNGGQTWPMRPTHETIAIKAGPDSPDRGAMSPPKFLPMSTGPGSTNFGPTEVGLSSTKSRQFRRMQHTAWANRGGGKMSLPERC